MSIGNNYLLWAIGSDNQVQALDPSTNSFVTKSDNEFAFDLGVSEDGTIWVISTIPDPNGGAKIFWSPGDGTWNEVQKPTKQAAQICGTSYSNCMYVSETGDVVQMSTDGTSYNLLTALDITDIDYGGGYYWAIMPLKPGGIPCLQFAKVTTPPLTWKAFAGNVIPNNISVNYSGDCYAVNNYNPMYYSKDGSTSNTDGTGANGITLQITFKNTYYLLSNNANAQGNEIMIWVDQQGGIWQNTGLRAIKIVSSWYNS
ncbi:MAG: hypothetical protein IPJ74_26230 [Saprospiraceae bacterium]|nr:hypothetical protein [Saprospiraceae bacterium]